MRASQIHGRRLTEQRRENEPIAGSAPGRARLARTTHLVMLSGCRQYDSAMAGRAALAKWVRD